MDNLIQRAKCSEYRSFYIKAVIISICLSGAILT